MRQVRLPRLSRLPLLPWHTQWWAWSTAINTKKTQPRPSLSVSHRPLSLASPVNLKGPISHSAWLTRNICPTRQSECEKGPRLSGDAGHLFLSTCRETVPLTLYLGPGEPSSPSRRGLRPTDTGPKNSVSGTHSRREKWWIKRKRCPEVRRRGEACNWPGVTIRSITGRWQRSIRLTFRSIQSYPLEAYIITITERWKRIMDHSYRYLLIFFSGYHSYLSFCRVVFPLDW